jgi:hypothetical protein
MKIYQATIESNNRRYLHTLLIVAENEELAHKQLCEQQKRQVKYTRKLEELKIDLKTPNVIEYVGWGHNDSDNGYDD